MTAEDELKIFKEAKSTIINLNGLSYAISLAYAIRSTITNYFCNKNPSYSERFDESILKRNYLIDKYLSEYKVNNDYDLSLKGDTQINILDKIILKLKRKVALMTVYYFEGFTNDENFKCVFRSACSDDLWQLAKDAERVQSEFNLIMLFKKI